MDSETLKEHILELEKSLLQPEVRQSAEKVAKILSDDFVEFCSSGRIYNYKKGDVIACKNNSDIQTWEIKDFSIDILAKDIVLAKYKATKHSKVGGDKVCSLRSSIWKHVKGSWKMIFHQGTLTDQKFT